MRCLVDAQIPPGLCDWLREQGVDADHVTDVLGGQTPDADIANHAEANSLVLITKDDDFRLRHPPRRYRLVWLRCGNIKQPRAPQLAERPLAGGAAKA